MARRYMTINLGVDDATREAIRRVAVQERTSIGDLIKRALNAQYGPRIARELACFSGVQSGEEKRR